MGHQSEPRKRTYGNMQVLIANLLNSDIDAATDPRGLGKAIVRRGVLAN